MIHGLFRAFRHDRHFPLEGSAEMSQFALSKMPSAGALRVHQQVCNDAADMGRAFRRKSPQTSCQCRQHPLDPLGRTLPQPTSRRTYTSPGLARMLRSCHTVFIAECVGGSSRTRAIDGKASPRKNKPNLTDVPTLKVLMQRNRSSRPGAVAKEETASEE